MTELDASAVAAREDVEALVGLLARSSVRHGRVFVDISRASATGLAECILASSWLAAHDERVRAAERERLAAEEQK